jgi:peptidyl-dipeptidase Dcp
VFTVLLSAHSDEALQTIDAEYSPKLTAHRDAITLNPRLFGRVKSLHGRRASLGLDPEQLQLLEERYRSDVRAGAALSSAAQDAVRANNVARANAVAEMRRRILAEVNAAALVVDERALLDGLPESDVAAAAAAATARGLAGTWVLPLQNTTQQPPLAYLRNRAMRERLFTASVSRNTNGGNDTTALVLQMARLRAERAVVFLLPAKPPDAARDGGVDLGRPRRDPRVGGRGLRLGGPRAERRGGGAQSQTPEEPPRNSHRPGS